MAEERLAREFGAAIRARRKALGMRIGNLFPEGLKPSAPQLPPL
ncbi:MULTISPECIES: hypothetical protein [Paracoccus]|nr:MULTISPECIES: hypothetical protein [Paracoccus]